MLLSLVATSLVLHAASISPATVPAKGAQEAIITLDKPGRVIIRATSASGTRCSLVDHVRGPFANSGRAGVESCVLDELLDAGSYKLRLSSKVKGTGHVALSVTDYKETNPKPVRLEPRREVTQRLRPGEQASFWLQIDKRQPVTVRFSGRNVGDIRLWRNGQWIERISPRDEAPRPFGGQPIYEWWLEQPMEPGVYLLTAYGTSPKVWTDSELQDDQLTVAYGFPLAPVERLAQFTLPVHGVAAYELPNQPLALFLSREGNSTSATRLSLHSIQQDGATSTGGIESGCSIESKALISDCSTQLATPLRKVALVRGEPGTKITLQWAPLVQGAMWMDGAYAESFRQLNFHVPKAGDYLVAMPELPVDSDSAPMGCVLEEIIERDRRPVDYVEKARDAVEVTPQKPFKRAFNYQNAGGALLWFNLTRSHRFNFSTSGARKNRCELYLLNGDKRERLTQTEPNAERCEVSYSAPPGRYELRIWGGTEGIETVTVAPRDVTPTGDTPTKTACSFHRVRLNEGPARVISTRSTQGSLRGLVLRALPLQLEEPLTIILDAKQSLKVPVVSASSALEVRSLRGERFSCAFNGTPFELREGRCTLPSTAGELQLQNSSDAPISFSIRRAAPPPQKAPPLVAFSPTLQPPPHLAVGAPMYFNFERAQQHSVTFDVKDAGLYHVQTLGLLATTCTIRTPVIEGVGAASGGGRGRNCLVSTYLRPGRYLYSARTTGQSRGRGGLLIERRPVKAADQVSSDSEVYFRVDAGELIQQKLRVTRSGVHSLNTSSQAGAPQCRLDDSQGWPALPVPTPCSQSLRLAKGGYLWTQLPLTVESMRRTSLERVRPTPTLTGNKPHRISLNQWHRAALGKDGKDEFVFDVPARMNVHFALTNGMQGRLMSVDADGKHRPVDVIAPFTPELTRPQGLAAPTSRYQPEAHTEQYEEDGAYERGGASEGHSEEEQAPSDAQAENEDHYASSGDALPAADSPAPVGRALLLSPGSYRLVAEHSKGDVAITYALYLKTEVFAPGVTQVVNVPGVYPVRVPNEGTLRLFSRGDTDVRCRLFNDKGVLVAENSDRGADWNCAFAEPVPGGDYTLALESQTQVPGPTKISVILAKVTFAGALSDAALKLDAGVTQVTLPAMAEDSVQQASFTANTAFSCALENPQGEVRARQSDVKRCVVLYRASGAPWRMRLWTLSGSAQVKGTASSRVITAGSTGGTLRANTALKVNVTAPGRYATSRNVFCVSASAGDLLRPCGPQASLDAGAWIFSSTGGDAALALTEVVDRLNPSATHREALSAQHTLLRQTSSSPSLHLLTVSVQPGDRGGPACRLHDGVAQQSDFNCFAATGVTTSSVARWWTAGTPTGEATVLRTRVPMPAASTALAMGVFNLAWTTGESARLTLPAESVRVQLSLPADAWAVLLSDKDTAQDLCAPSAVPSRCVFASKSGSVVVHSPNDRHVHAEVVAVEHAARRASLTRLYETFVRAPTSLRLELAANTASDSQLNVRGALRCVTTLTDGARLEGCGARIPRGHGGELTLEVDPGEVSAVLAPPDQLNAATLNVSAKGGPELPAGRAQKLTGQLIESSFTVATDGVVHLRANTGVCGIVQGTAVLAAAGSDSGCAMDRLLKAGSYKLVVRAFADRPLTGNVSWTHEPVRELDEGIAKDESFIGPTQTRFFRFRTESKGRIGFGLQVSAELLQCSVLDVQQNVLGDGCQQFLELDRGTYLLAVHAPASSRTLKFKPVLVGLAGAKADVPETYLREFFNRIGVAQ